MFERLVRLSKVGAVAAAALVLVGCGDSDDDIKKERGAEINVSNKVSFPNIAMGGSGTQTIRVANTGETTLSIDSLQIKDTDGDDYNEFSREGDWQTAKIEPNDAKTISVIYSPVNKNAGQGTLVIKNNALNASNGVTKVNLEADELKPQIQIQEKVNFSRVQKGDTASKTVALQNVGYAPLNLEDVILDGSDNFKVTYPSSEKPDDPSADREEPPFSTLGPRGADKSSMNIRITFEPDTSTPESADLIFVTNDPDDEEFPVKLLGNSGSGCLEVSFGQKVDFGQSAIGQVNDKIGTIANCSADTKITLKEIAITDDGGGVYKLAEGSLPGALPQGETVIPAGDQVKFKLQFTPKAKKEYKGELLIRSDAPTRNQIKLPITGKGSDNACPKAVGQGWVEGTRRPSNEITTLPLKTVQLDASQSTDPDGNVQRYQWTLVESPEGSTARLLPDSTSKKPKLYLDISGEYKVELIVFDAQGQKSCEQSTVTIKAVPEDDIHVQLVWDTPKDPDQTNECGADLDLHYLHEKGKWTDPKWDIYYKNKTADWGQPGSSDDPQLDIDDINGAGPENVNQSNPQSGVNYRVGVYYYRSESPAASGLGGGLGVSCPSNEPSNYGHSLATIRVFIDGVLQYEKENKYMAKTGQFWEVGLIQWPAGRISPIDNMHDGYPGVSNSDGLFGGG